MRRVKFALPFALCLAFATTACNTIENRRSLYSPKKADGPYTRALREGTWENMESRTVDQQYRDSRRQAKKGGSSSSSGGTNDVSTPLPAAEPKINN
jgi:hypothetical protein